MGRSERVDRRGAADCDAMRTAACRLQPVQPNLADEGGRGLMLVDALTERWGWNLPPSGRGKVVWALIEN